MADTKISALPASTTPLAGTEVLPIVQSGATKQVSVANLTAGRLVEADKFTAATNVIIGASSGATTYGALNVNGNIATYTNAKLNLGADQGGGAELYYDGSGDLYITPRSGYNTKLTAGNLVIGTSGKGIDFSASSHAAGMTSELLNDYEEGTWTPTITSQTGSLTSYTSIGYYTKVGRIVTVFGSFAITSAGTAAGQAFVSGLPFTSLNLPAGPDVIGTGVVREYNMTGNAYFINVADNATTASIVTALNAGITWLNGYGYLWSVTYQTA